jgi:hypothetical protein
MDGKIKLLSALLIGIVFVLPSIASANFAITEIMYDPKDSDSTSGSEWIEVKNEGSEALDLATWLFFEANTNHGITGIEGGTEIPAGGYAVISRDTSTFKNFFTGFSGPLFKASFSLSDSETFGLKNDKDGAVTSSVTYTSDWGAKNDGNSLQKSGSAWVAATPTPAQANSTTSSMPENTSTTSANNSSTNTTTTSAATLDEKNFTEIFAEAPDDKIAMALADVGFTGKSFDIKKEPLKNARYLWNFGDGTTAEGQTVLHSYVYPGEYLVHLYVSSGEYTATDTLKVKVVPSALSISDVSYDNFGSVTISNNSDNKLDVSFWRIKSGKTYWSFPRDSYILPKGMTVISGLRAALEISPNNEVLLLYPNYNIAFRYQYSPQSTSIASVNLNNAPQSSVPTARVIQTKTPTAVGNVSGAYAEVVSSDVNSGASEVIINDNLISESNLASAGFSTEGSQGGLFKWGTFLAGFLGLIIFSLFYFRDKVSVSALPASAPKDVLNAEDFDIEEEMP